MQTPFEYRSYEVASEDGRYCAKSLDGESCDLQSRYLLRVLRAVDVLWTSIELSVVPTWFATWMNNPTPSIDLDAAMVDMGEAEHHRETRDDFQDMISILKFPISPLALVRKAATAASAAAVCLMTDVSSMGVIELFAA